MEALRVLRELERDREHGWVPASSLASAEQRAVDAAAGRGLVELADREMRAELSVYEGRPILWAARLSAHGHDVLTYIDASPAPAHQQQGAEGERLVELYRQEMEALRLYVHIGERMRVPPAEGLAQRVRAARQLGNRWSLWLTEEQVESVAYVFYLRSMGGSVAEANRFVREYGVAFLTDE